MSIGRNFDIEPVRVLSIRSGPVRSGPVRSDPIRSGPVRSDPGFANGLQGIVEMELKNGTSIR